MLPTRRLRSVGGLVIAMLGGAVLTAQPIVLLGATTLLAGIVIIQWQATTEFTTVQDHLTVEAAAAEQRTVPDGSLPITITATLDKPAAATVSLAIAYGPGLEGPTETVSLEPGATQTHVRHDVAFPIAGQFSLPTIRCTIEDSSGTVTETFEIDEHVTVTVEPPAPSDIHVGQRGDRLGGQYGEHRSEMTGSGTEIAELREYRPGDSVGMIDWKATARLNDPYVREFEAETARHMTLLIDGRPSLWDGPRGRSKLAYLREVALGFVQMAETAADPLSLSVIEEQGLRIQHATAETTTHYQRVRWTLQNIAPEQSTTARSTATARRGPAEAGHIAQQLTGQTSAFATTLQPYFADPGSYIERLADDPLFGAVRRSTESGSQYDWTVLFTDDTDPRRTIEAAKMAARNDGVVTVFVTPSLLFTANQHPAQQLYDDYIDFEKFRSELDAIPRVTAYEVSPESQLRAVLAADRTQTTRTAGTGDV